MGNSQWERDWNGLHNWESRAHRLHEVIVTQHDQSQVRERWLIPSIAGGLGGAEIINL